MTSFLKHAFQQKVADGCFSAIRACFVSFILCYAATYCFPSSITVGRNPYYDTLKKKKKVELICFIDHTLTTIQLAMTKKIESVCVCGASLPVIIINTSDRLAHKETNKVMLAYLHIFPSEATQRFILFYIHLWCILPTLLWTIKLHMDTVQIQSSWIFSSNNDHKIQSVQLAWGKIWSYFQSFPTFHSVKKA